MQNHPSTERAVQVIASPLIRSREAFYQRLRRVSRRGVWAIGFVFAAGVGVSADDPIAITEIHLSAPKAVAVRKVRRPAFDAAAPVASRLSDLVDLSVPVWSSDASRTVGHRAAESIGLNPATVTTSSPAIETRGNDVSVDSDEFDLKLETFDFDGAAPPTVDLNIEAAPEVVSETSKPAGFALPESAVVASEAEAFPQPSKMMVRANEIASSVAELRTDLPTPREVPPPRMIARKPSAVQARSRALPLMQKPTVTPQTLAAASRLRMMARESMLRGKRLFDRGAVYSAHEAVDTALRQLVQSCDLTAGTNENTAALTDAVQAIAESKDFATIYGINDKRTLERMVASHQTSALKDRDLADMPSFAATAVYLQQAEELLVEALKPCVEAGDALILLGRIEQSLAPNDTVYRGAVALTMHRAAARIRPDSAFIRRELGVTMMDQGMDEMAATALRQSLSMRASRRGFKHLLLVSERIGDARTAQMCGQALQSSDLPSESLVTQVSAAAFDASHRPEVVPIKAAVQKRASATASPTPATSTSTDPPKTAAEKWLSIFKR